MKRIRIVLLGILLPVMTAGCGMHGGGDAMTPEESEGSIDFQRITSFDGEVLTVDLDVDGFPVLNTARDVESSTAYRTTIPGHSGRSWLLLNTAHDSTTLASVLTSWNSDDPQDYLAGGWWLHFPDQHPPALDFWDPRTSLYLFVDGPEIDLSNSAPFPLEGQASYEGAAAGAFLYGYGDDWGDDVRRTLAGAAYGGTMTLEVDFSQGTLEGCIGCKGDIVIRPNRPINAFLGEAPVFATDDYVMQFAATPFETDGTFEGEGATLTHPERSLTVLDGYWGGQLSGSPDAAGDPRLVTGFNSVYFREPDGSRGVFFGAFISLSDAFRGAGESEQAPDPQ